MRKLLIAKIGVGLGLAFVFALAQIFGAVAQSDGLFATIARVESEAFPQVVVFASVFDQNGPLDGLTTDDFEIFENDRPAPAESVTVEEVELQGLRLVLALDVSIPNANNFDTVKEAAKSLVSGMGPRDRVAIVSFAQEATLVHDFTNNTQELQAVIDSLAVEVSYTASHQALAEAVYLLNQQPLGKKAVVVITDSRDNTGADAGAVDSTIEQARQNNVPIYVAGFGSKVQNDSLREKVGATGGQYFSLSRAGEVLPALQDLEAQLRRGYRITFFSGLKASNAEQDLTLVVTSQGQETEATGSFVATAGPVAVSLPNLADGQTVAKVVGLSAQVTAPAPQVEVTYLLDGRPLASLTGPPYTYQWDSSEFEPGAHALTVKAVDSAGNTGQAEITLNIARPASVTIPITQTQVELGDEIAIAPQVEVDPQTGQVNLEFLFDGQVQQSISAPPYRFLLDSSEHLVGEHTFTVRVTDSWGQTAQDSVDIQFLPPSLEPVWSKRVRAWLGVDRPTFERWLTLGNQILVVAVALITILIAVIIALVILRGIARSQKESTRQKRLLQIVNLGNVRSHYQLRAEEALDDLKFQFAIRGEPLPQTAAAQSRPAPAGAGGYAAPPPASPQHPPSGRPAPAGAPAARAQAAVPQTGAGFGQTVGRAQATGAKAQGCATFINDILVTLSALLPGSAGKAVSGLSRQMSAGEQAVRQTTHAPKRMARAAGQLKGQVGQVAPGKEGNQGQGRPQPAAQPRPAGRANRTRTETDIIAVQPQAPQPPPPPQPQPQPQPGAPVQPAANGRQTPGEVWAETPVIDPGSALTVELIIDPANPYEKQEYTFTVNSRSAEQPEATLVSEQGTVQMVGIPWFKRFFPVFVAVVFLLVLTVAVGLLTAWRLIGFNIFGWLP